MITKKYNKRAVLLTATIIPNSVYTEHTIYTERLNEYIFAIDFYLKTFINDDIYFLENSEFDLNKVIELNEYQKSNRFFILKFQKSNRFYEGKGYQEFQMLDEATLQLKSQYDSFIKITGRYLVKNAFAITNFKCNNIVIDLHKNTQVAQTYFIYYSTSFYLKHLLGQYKNVNDNEGAIIEKIIYKKLHINNINKDCQLFHKTPTLDGISGSYKMNLKRNILKVFIRNCERFVYTKLNIKHFRF